MRFETEITADVVAYTEIKRGAVDAHSERSVLKCDDDSIFKSRRQN